MAKMRVYELARELEVESKVLLARMKSAGIAANSHQSTITDEGVAAMREAFGIGAAAIPAKATPVIKKRPKTILRRRKKVEEEAPDESAAAASATLESPAAADDSSENVAAATAAPAAPAIESDEAKPDVAVAAQEPLASEAEPVDDQSPQEPVAAVATEEAPQKKKKVGGATIVRRATAEEQEDLENQNRRRTGRKEDHRGTRVTGLGLLSNRVGREDSASEADPNAPFPDASELGAGAGRRGAAAGSKLAREREEEEGRARVRAQKQRRESASLTTRALIARADSVTTELTSDAPAVTNFRGRTVYTPTSSARRRDLKRRKDLQKTAITTPRAAYRVVTMGETITVAELGKQLSIKATEIIKKLMGQGEMVTLNQELDQDTATLIAQEYNYEVKSAVTTIEDILAKPAPDAEELQTRAPIVTVMGHVDHGKTSILDAIKQSDVAGGEAGGITQHIGAYAVEHNGKKITFLDTPGHEAFSAMRARGAGVTDIVVLVVAADDGVMPQTVEAISHAKAAEVPLIVAVNKIDKPNINIDRVYTELTEHGVQAEEWGGETQTVKCSATTREGLDELLEAIQLQAELLELKASSQGQAEGVVIEAHLDKGRGPVATVVVSSGTLKVGDFVVAGTETGRVRAMQDHRGLKYQEAGPSTPVEIVGLSGVPMAGDKLNAVSDEKTAREASDWRQETADRARKAASSASSLEDLLNRVKSDEAPTVSFIVKGDTQGSVEAVCDSIGKIASDKVRNSIPHSAVGGVTESDITLAAATGSIIIAFNVRAARGLDEVADAQGVTISYFSIIYDIVDAVRSIMVGKLPPILNEVFQGRAEVRKPISVPKIGTVAGSAVIDGKIVRNASCRLIRDDIVIYEGKLASLRRFKDDVKEVATGYECGISIEGYNDVKEGDVIEAFTMEESTATL